MTPDDILKLADLIVSGKMERLLRALAGVVALANLIVELPDTDRDFVDNEKYWVELRAALGRIEALKP